jgi:hypothetical protein
MAEFERSSAVIGGSSLERIQPPRDIRVAADDHHWQTGLPMPDCPKQLVVPFRIRRREDEADTEAVNLVEALGDGGVGLQANLLMVAQQNTHQFGFQCLVKAKTQYAGSREKIARHYSAF